MGVLKNYLLFFRILNRLFALVGFPCGLEVYRMAEIIAVVENVDNGAGQPEAGVLRVIAAGAPRALKLHRPQRDDLHFPQAAGDLSGTVALGGKLENQLDNRRGFRVDLSDSHCPTGSRREPEWRAACRSCPLPGTQRGSSCSCLAHTIR